MATADAANSKPRAAQRAVLFHGLEKVLRARRFEAAAGARSAQFVQNRRNDLLIAADEEPDDPFHGNSRNGGSQQSGTPGELDPLGFDSVEFCVHRAMPRNGDDQMRRFD